VKNILVPTAFMKYNSRIRKEVNVKQIIKLALPLLAALIHTVTFAEEESNNYFLFRGSHPGGGVIDYRSLYFSYALHYEPTYRTALHLAFLKGSGESGYYPAGYFTESEGGLYEKASLSLEVTDSERRRRFVIGNYSLLFGQGLLFGSTYPLVFSNPFYDAARYRDTMHPAASASKAGMLEGVALEYRLNGVTLRPFLSWNSFDCSAGESDYYLYNDNDGDGLFPNHPESPGGPDPDPDDFTGRGENFPAGYSCKTELFRSLREEPEYDELSGRQKRSNLTEYLAGVNVSAQTGTLRAGGTLLYSRFNRLVDPYYSFDPDEGDKTGYYFRGKDYAAASLYFKSYGLRSDESLELFGEAVGTFYRQISYYPEFNGDISSAFGLSGGLRKASDGEGFVFWGAYLPANLVNPHGQEFPDGASNLTYGLFGYHRTGKRRRFDGRLLYYRELYNEDDPDEPESELSVSCSLERGFGKKNAFDVEQKIALIDNYYSEPGEVSWKVSSELSAKLRMGRFDSLVLSVENRAGGPVSGKAAGGIGVSAELIRVKPMSSAAFRVMGYVTADDEFGVLYPYERPLYSWSVFGPSLRGSGVYGCALALRELEKHSAVGAKLRWKLDFLDSGESEAGFSLLSEVGF
jgi:hypothetical protein